MRDYLITRLCPADGTEEHWDVRASSLSEALAIMERADAGLAERIYGIAPEDYDLARAEGIAFNVADGLLI